MRVKDARRLRDMRREFGPRRHIRVPEAVADFDPSRIEHELNPGTSNSRQSKTLHRVLRLVIEQDLSERQREVAYCFYFDNMAVREIAEKLGVAPSTVSRTLTRAENNIRNHLKYCLLFLRISAESEEDDDD